MSDDPDTTKGRIDQRWQTTLDPEKAAELMAEKQRRREQEAAEQATDQKPVRRRKKGTA